MGSTWSDISSLANNFQENALLAARQAEIMRPLVRNFAGGAEMNPRKLYTYGDAGTLTIVVETTDATASSFAPSLLATLTPYGYQAQYTMTDMLLTSDWNETIANAGTDAGARFVVDSDTKLVGLFSTFTGGTVGTAGGTLTWDNIFRARAYLAAAHAPLPYYAVIRPEHSYYLLSAASGVPTLTQSPKFMDDLAGQAYIGSYGGINFYEDANITSGTAAAAGMFSRDAIAFDMRRAPRTEMQRDASKGGGLWELNFSTVYAYGLYRPTFGCYMIGTSV